MNGVACLALVCAPAVALSAPASYTFGGFSPGGREYWKRGSPGGDQVCEPIAADRAPSCRPTERKEVKGWTRPPRARALGGVTLTVVVEDDARVVLAAGERRLGVYTPGARVSSVNANVFVSPDADVVIVEYEVAGPGGKRADAVGFDVAASPPPAPVARPVARAPVTGGGNAYERAVKQGGVWEQRIVPCDRAGVTLTLKKTRAFAIRILSRCQGNKDQTDLDGKWTSEGNDTVVLHFENEGAAAEALVCRFARCEETDEECLTCGDDDTAFTLEVVRR
jgi:hypothetical protein